MSGAGLKESFELGLPPDAAIVTEPRRWQWSPLAQARWQRFRANRLAWGSLWVFGAVLGVCLLAPVIANDRPLLIRYDHQLYWPLIKSYPETAFGGQFETETNYREPFIQDKLKRDGWMVWPLIPYADQTVNFDVDQALPAPPSHQNWLGTDDLGRDLLARLIYGLRVSLVFGIALTIAGSAIGILVGAVQGYYGGWVDLLGQRFMEVWGGLPVLFLLIILASFFTPTVYWLFGIMLLFGWMSLVGLVRAEFLRARNLDYVRAARGLGASNRQIMFEHILPNALSSSLSQLPFILTANVTALTALDYLGYGLPPGSPSLGEIMQQAKTNLDAPWIALSGFVTLASVLSLLIFIGEGLRDAYDPRRQH